MKRILVTGSNGLLGQNLVKLLIQKEYEVFALSRGKNRLKDICGYTYIDIDVTNHQKLSALISQIKPDVIVHTAAMTNVDQCENFKKECELLNVEVVKNITVCCRNEDIHLIHLSTDFIFDGITGYYKENDIPNPVNYYGKSKLKSEEIVTSAHIKYTILRTILVYGLTEEMKSNVILWVKNNLENNNPITVVTDQWRMPTHVDDLAWSCLQSIEKGVFGVFHISSNQLLSIYDIAILVAEEFDLDKNLIRKISSKELNLPAARPEKTGFDLSLSIKELNFLPHSFYEGLQLFKNQLER